MTGLGRRWFAQLPYNGLSSGAIGRAKRATSNTIGPLPNGDNPIQDQDPPNPAQRLGPRFLCHNLPDSPGQTVTLDKDQARHATRVLRLSEGDPVQLIDGRGAIAQATLTHVAQPTTCTIRFVEHVSAPTPRIELATAIPKGPRADAMVNDLAQLGTDRLIPLITQRSVVVPRENKLERLTKAVAEAGKQSGSAHLMRIDPATNFADALTCDADFKLIADPYAKPLVSLAQQLEAVTTVRILIGPEGGLTDEEHAAAVDAGFTPWRFSPNILRIETAAAAAAAILRSFP